MSNSTHKVEVVPVSLLKHPDADSLSLVQVFGYTVAVKTELWKDGDLGAYVPPDSVVDVTRPEFAFLKTDNMRTKERIKVRRMRGQLSMGILVHAPEGSKEGDDVAELLGVEHWEPEIKATLHDNNVGGPPLYSPKYDIDAWYRYLRLFEEGEPVYITEKLNGSNMRVVYSSKKDKIYVGSRNWWKEETDTNLFWRAFRNTKNLETFARCNPDKVIYGEAYGAVGGFWYDINELHNSFLKIKEPRFRAFDILNGDKWLDVQDFIIDSCFGLPIVPTILMDWSLNKEEVIAMAEGKSELGNHIREGIVIKPMVNRYDNRLGRVFLKLVGEGYYNKG